MAEHEVQTVTLSGGHTIPAALLVCPKCNSLDLNLSVNTSVTPWIAHCGCGHTYPVDPRAQA